ncbi:hypothetical protein L6452_28993 [Arctium lappa]|uniref:Uncharacterized protein n=1 Tax=Arctium lappa TaxID=4217 RepID=A0ACB8ZKD6_ARCLA|nr:hypothetical protein L6452_28993 [Arctium lappa]
MVAIPYRGTSETLLPAPLQSIPSSNSPSSNLLDTNITVTNVCRKTEYPDQCISTVSPFLKGNSDISTILDRTMKSTAWLIKLGSIHSQRLSNAPGKPKDEIKILKSCKDNYDNALSDFQEAMKALACKDLERMNSMLKAVLSELEDCRDEYLGKTFPLTTYDDKVTKMTSNCLAIVDMVHQHH